MLRRLRIRFVCVTMSITGVMLCILLGMVMHSTQKNLEEQSLHLLRSSASEIILSGRMNGDIPRNKPPCIVLHISNTGTIHVYNAGDYDLSDDELVYRLVQDTLAQSEQSGVLDEYALRYYRISSPLGQRIAYEDITGELQTLKTLLRSCLLIGAAGFCLFLAISLFLARWVVKPVEVAWNQQRQFVTDASHELKTPLTVIMTNAELLQNEQSLEKEGKAAVSGILTMGQHMRHLVESLLDLARVDNGAVRKNFETFSFSDLVQDTVIDWETLFYEGDRILSDEIQPGVCVNGSREHLRQVLEVLLDNAKKYSVPRSEVLVTLGNLPHRRSLLTVASIGDTISDEDLKKIFTRFYRVDSSRSRDGSYGLGLSIAKQIVQDHKGKIWAESRDGINRFYVELPTE